MNQEAYQGIKREVTVRLAWWADYYDDYGMLKYDKYANERIVSLQRLEAS